MERIRATLEAKQVWIYFAAIAIGAICGVTFPAATRLEAAINPALAVMLFATFLQGVVSENGK